MKRYKPLFKEAIYGNNAIVYHRTSTPDLINKVYTSGFKTGGGDTYGKGFYSTYDLKSQQREEMKQYGDIIVKFQISLQRFFFFDFEEFKKSPTYTNLSKKIDAKKITTSNFINLQLQFFGIKDIEYKHKRVKFSSEIAIWMWKEIKNKIDGIIFTGSRDGKVLVCYDINRIIPLAFSIDNGKTFEKVTPQNLKYIKKVHSSKDFSNKEKIKYTLPDWVVKSGNEPRFFEYDDEGNFVWEKGFWKSGTWEKGIWKFGIWETGIWKFGTWGSGIWQDGTWKSGIWESGTWETGLIYDPELKKNVKSDVSPKEYFKGKKGIK